MTKPHGNKGRKHTQETRVKIAEAMRNNSNATVPDELRIHPQRQEKGAHALKGKPKSAEHKQKIARAMRHNSNASVLNRVLKLQTPQQIKPLKTVSQRFNESPQEYKLRKGHSVETIAKIRAAAQGNHNALKQQVTRQAPQNPSITAVNEEPLEDLEAELLAMMGPVDNKPQELHEPLEEVLGKDFFDGWELTDD